MTSNLKKASNASIMSRRQSTRKTAVEESVDRLDMPKPHKAVFVDAKAMKDKLRENMHKPRYDVTNFYKKEGFFSVYCTR
mmetsp:Transcript_67500/g.123241  ORF Transcript_67500/g.123241 Transcript_67500/m.123241 type:complete len:80 (-) Transcript_67500:13-252(-)